MNAKTKNMKWLPWGLSVAFVIAIIVITVLLDLPRYLVTPWQIGTSTAINLAIAKFSSEAVRDGAYWVEWFHAGSKVLLLLVIGPAFWILGEISSQYRKYEKGIVWYTGTVVVMLGIVAGLVGSVMSVKNYYSYKDIMSAEKMEYEMTKQMNLVGFDLYEYYHLPEKYDGGSGSYEAFKKSGESGLEYLEDLEKDMSHDVIIGEVNADSSITFYVVSPGKGVNPDFENINGEQGYMQARMTVYPVDDRMEFDRKL